MVLLCIVMCMTILISNSRNFVVVNWGFPTLLTSQIISVAFYSEREKADKFCSEVLISAWGSFTCRKSTTWLYFPSERSHTPDFYALKKIHRPRPGLNFEPTNLGSSGKYDNHGTTGVDPATLDWPLHTQWSYPHQVSSQVSWSEVLRFLWGRFKYQVYEPLFVLRNRIRAALATTDKNMLRCVYKEMNYRLDVCRIKEHIGLLIVTHENSHGAWGEGRRNFFIFTLDDAIISLY